MPKLNQRGVIHFIVLLIILLGIVAGVWLTTHGSLKLFSKATVSGPITATTSFVLSSSGNSFNVGDMVEVKLLMRSDIAAANLFTAKINFNKELLAVDRIDVSNSFAKNWVENNFDNNAGTLALTGGVPNPGLQTNVANAPASMALIYFKALKAGTANISFADTSAIYSNTDNINILTSKDPINLSIASGGVIPESSLTPSPSSSPTPTPTAAPSATGNYRKDYSGIQGQNNLYYLAYIKSSGTYTQASFDGKNWRYTGPGSDRNFLIENNKIAPSYPSHAVIRWVSPKSGTVSIEGYFQRCCTEVGDFNHHPLAIYSVRKNTSQVLWNQSTEGTIKYPYSLTSTVSEGDNIEFWVDANNDSGWDGTYMDFTISYSITPITSLQVSGDGNKDGKVNLIDMSILLTDWMKHGDDPNFHGGIDMNGDGVINSFDSTLLRNLLIQKGVIAGN